MNLALKATRSRLEPIRMYLVPRVLTTGLKGFAREEGILDVIEGLGGFTVAELSERLEQRLGYRLKDRSRRRMVSTLVDFLKECALVQSLDGALFFAGEGLARRPATDEGSGLTAGEEAVLREHFSGQVDFFKECMGAAGGFLRGGESPLEFSSELAPLWDAFLGNYEYSTMRRLLLRLMGVEDSPGFKIMDLCYGLGHGVAGIMAEYPKVDLTALDFKGTYRNEALGKLAGVGPKGQAPCVKWVDGPWKGFGCRLPFNASTFDAVHFTCSDPYVPPQEREGFYGEVLRVLKPGGALGLLSWGYPDEGATIIKDPWIRRQVLAHDFAESVCSGWQGFYDIRETWRMFSRIGFERDESVSSFDSTLGASVTVLRKPL